MARISYTRNDIERLCDRLNDRAGSVMLFDMPRLAADMQAASKLLKFMLAQGIPPTTIEIENNSEQQGGR
jgi:hypothetical protein